MIQTTQLSYAYPGQPAFRFPDVACARNEHALILGPSGAGKTTLLHLLGGILRPTAGSIRIAETAMHELSDNALDQFRGQKIGIVFQRPHFIRSISALDNVLLTQNLSGRKSDSTSAMQMLKRLHIENKAHHRPHNMSIGEQQRLAIARALINHPEVILADEPSSALDDKNCHDMIQLLLEVASENNASLIVVTHDTRIKDMIPRHILLN